MTSVRKNFLLNSAYRVLQIITPLVTTPYLARVLGPDQIGVYSYTESVATYFAIFIVLGLSTYGVRTIASCGHDFEKRSRTFWCIWFSQLMLGIPVCVLYLVYAIWSPNAPQICSLGWGLLLIASTFDISYFFFGIEEFKIPTLCSCIIKLLEVTGIFVFVKSQADVGAYVILDGTSFLCISLVLWPFLHRYVDFVRPSLRDVLDHIPPSARLFIPIIAVNFYTTFDRVMLGSLSDMQQTGYFDYAYKLSKMPLSVIVALGVVMMPHMSSLIAQNKRERMLELLEKSLWIMLVCAFCLSFGIAACAPEFAPIFLGDSFTPAVPAMIALSVMVPLACCTNVIGQQYLLPTNQDTRYTIACCVGAATSIAMCVVLIPLTGALGAGIATAGAELGILVVECIFVRNELPLKSYVRQILPYVLVGLIMALSIRVFAYFVVPILGLTAIELALEILFGGLVFGVITIAICVATRNKHAYELVRPIILRVFELRR